MAEQQPALLGFDTQLPNMARMYDYALGGKDNFAADREAVQELFSLSPENRHVPLANRRFLSRAVRFAVLQGVRQFLDLGTGLPSQGHVHEIVAETGSDAHVVYVDYDPVVVAHARALLRGSGQVAVVQADIRDPQGIPTDPAVTASIDFPQPVAVLFVSVLHGIPDQDDPAGIVGAFARHLAPGSYMILSHLTSEGHPPELVAQKEKVFARSSAPMSYRSRAEIMAMFDGFDLVEPGLTAVTRWRGIRSTPTWTPRASGGSAESARRRHRLNPARTTRTGSRCSRSSSQGQACIKKCLNPRFVLPTPAIPCCARPCAKTQNHIYAFNEQAPHRSYKRADRAECALVAICRSYGARLMCVESPVAVWVRCLGLLATVAPAGHVTADDADQRPRSREGNLSGASCRSLLTPVGGIDRPGRLRHRVAGPRPGWRRLRAGRSGRSPAQCTKLPGRTISPGLADRSAGPSPRWQPPPAPGDHPQTRPAHPAHLPSPQTPTRARARRELLAEDTRTGE